MDLHPTYIRHRLSPSGAGLSLDRPARSRSRHAAIAALALAIGGLVGCSSIDVPASSAEHARAGQLPIYMAQQGTAAPTVRADLGPVEGYGCNPQRDFPKDVNIQRSDALDQLRLRALKAGADGVIDVRLSPIQTDRRNACFQGMAARGEAVAFNGR